jgi:hypothetical protein
MRWTDRGAYRERDVDQIRRCRDAGMNAPLAKPVDPPHHSDESGIIALLHAASKTITVDLLRLEKAVIAHDIHAVAVSAHRLKGSSSSIHSMPLLAASSSAETAARALSPGIDPSLLIALREAVNELLVSIELQQASLGSHTHAPLR